MIDLEKVKRSRERSEKKEDKIDSSFLDGIDDGPKAIYSVEDHRENPKKQMRYTYLFGSKSSPRPFEVLFKSYEEHPETWGVSFSRGFDKLKADKDEAKIKKCLEGLESCIEKFVGGDMNEEIDSYDDLRIFRIKIEYGDNDRLKIIEDFFKDKKLFSLLKRDWSVRMNTRGDSYNIVAKQK